MSKQLKVIKILENYSSVDFANFLSKNDFPECNDYIIQNNLTYSKFLEIHEFQLKSWKNSVDFIDFNNFTKFHQKLRTSPEDFFQIIGTIKNINNGPKCEPPKDHQFARKVKHDIATKPRALTKPLIQRKPYNFGSFRDGHTRSASLDELDNDNVNKLNNQRTQSLVAISQENLTKVINRMPKKLPLPPKAVNIIAIPPLPQYFNLHPKPLNDTISRRFNKLDQDIDDNESDFEEALYKEPSDEDFEDEEYTYSGSDIQKQQHSPRSIATFSQLPASPKKDRFMKPRVAVIMKSHNCLPYNPLTSIIQQNSVGDDDEEDVHVYEELPPYPKQSHARQNTDSMDPTHTPPRRNRHADVCVVENYLSHRLAIQPITEHSRPLPPTPFEEYSLAHLKNETYFRDIDRKSAEKLLQTEPIGTFLVRPSRKFFCSISVKAAAKIFNFAMVKLDGNKLYLKTGNPHPDDSFLFHSIPDLIKHYLKMGIDIPNENKCTHLNLLDVMPPIR